MKNNVNNNNNYKKLKKKVYLKIIEIINNKIIINV